jgi:5-deoxy-glucuronate isomerase
MYFSNDTLKNGLNPYLTTKRGKGREIGMDVALLVLEPGEEFRFSEKELESALLLFRGAALWRANDAEWRVSRKNEFEEEASCLHVCAGTKVFVRAERHSEIYIQKVRNEARFAPKCYLPQEIQIQRAGETQLQGTMRRNIKTVFDYENAPYSNMVLGEVVNFPGKWSSYPPHHHPQPEVYFYRFDKPQGFGAGFANGEVHKTTHNGLLVIQSGFHSQVAAPGYGLCYVWGIRHLPGDPWKKTRIDDMEHVWMLQEDAVFLSDETEK